MRVLYEKHYIEPADVAEIAVVAENVAAAARLLLLLVPFRAKTAIICSIAFVANLVAPQ